MIETFKNKKIITKKKIKTCINKILSKKNYTNKDFRFIELYIQIYLLIFF